MKSQIIFNLDGRLAEGKSDLDGETATLLTRLAGIVDVASISGGRLGTVRKAQLLALLRGRTQTSGSIPAPLTLRPFLANFA
jgi:hypothetical protein